MGTIPGSSQPTRVLDQRRQQIVRLIEDLAHYLGCKNVNDNVEECTPSCIKKVSRVPDVHHILVVTCL